MFDTTFSRQSD